MNPTPALLLATDEEILVARLLARDEQALRILHDRYAPNLLAVIVRLVRDKSLAQDVLQEGLLKVWLSIDRVRCRARPLVYLDDARVLQPGHRRAT